MTSYRNLCTESIINQIHAVHNRLIVLYAEMNQRRIMDQISSQIKRLCDTPPTQQNAEWRKQCRIVKDTVDLHRQNQKEREKLEKQYKSELKKLQRELDKRKPKRKSSGRRRKR